MTAKLSNCATYQTLTKKQKLFTLEYLKDFNATQAAIRAGYSKKTSGSVGNENLQKPEIRAAMSEVSQILGDKEEKAIADVQELREYWTKIKRAHIGRVCQWGDGGLSFNSTSEGMAPEDMALIKKITVKEKTSPKGDFTEVQTSVELHDPLRASELLGKSLGVFIDKSEISGPDGGPVAVDSKLEIVFVNPEDNEGGE